MPTGSGVLDTFPKFLLHNAKVFCRPSGDAPQGLRHLADVVVGANVGTKSAVFHLDSEELGLAARMIKLRL